MSKAANAVPAGYHTITPQLTVDDAAKTIDWYKEAFGAKEGGRSLGPDGKIMHCELTIGDSKLMVNDVMPGMKGPRALGGSPAALWLYVNNSDDMFNRAVGAGGKVQMAMTDHFWGDRAGSLTDPAGYTWWIATRKEDFTPIEMRARADAFFKQTAGAAQHS